MSRVQFKADTVNDELGVVFGYLIVCEVKGEEYFDLHNDHITVQAMMEAGLEFMKSSRVGGVEHVDVGGEIPFAMPVTTETAKGMGFTEKPSKTGLYIGYSPFSDDLIKGFRDGTYTGFSIGWKPDVVEDV